jgi:hypothetical protein
MEDTSSKKLELVLGLLLAVFAAVLGINELGAGKYGDDEMIAHNKQAEAYSWYQSKSIKQTLVDGQCDMVMALLAAGAIKEGDKLALDTFLLTAKKESNRYKKEKTEILKGSSKIEKENWIQDKDGELGKIIGAEEWQEKADALGAAGDIFDLSTLLLQFSLVLGAIGLVLQNQLQRSFFAFVMLGLGCVGAFFCIKAYLAAMAIG